MSFSAESWPDLSLCGLTLQFSMGDITQTPVSCMVSSIGADMNPRKAGALARKVVDTGGQAVENDLSQQAALFSTTGAVITPSGNLANCQYIIHVNNTGGVSRFGERILTALDLANGKDLPDLAFPALGQGGCGHKPFEMAGEFYQAMSRFHARHQRAPPTLKTVHFLFDNSLMLKEFYNGFLDAAFESSPTNQSFGSPTGGFVSPSAPPDSPPTGSPSASYLAERLNQLHIADTNAPRSTNDSVRVPVKRPVPASISGSGATGSSTANPPNGPEPSELTSRAVDAFQCKICLSVIRPPVITCVHCRNLIGCNDCVAQAVLASSKCPYCRAQWRTNGMDVQELVGLDDFLRQLDKEDNK